MRDARSLQRFAAALALLLAGCTAAPVVGGLEETEASRILVALDESMIDATKEPESGGGAQVSDRRRSR